MGFQKTAENVMKKSAKIANPSGFWKPFNVGTVSYQKLFC
jgi:hypothetical protein